MDNGACWRCRFFDRDADTEGEGGFCRRHPPAHVVSDGDVYAAWPGVEYTDWCGDFVDESAGVDRVKNVTDLDGLWGK